MTNSSPVFTTKGIAQEAERKLTNHISHIGCYADSSMNQGWIYGFSLVKRSPVYSSTLAYSTEYDHFVTHSYFQIGVAKFVMNKAQEAKKDPTLIRWKLYH